MKKKIKTMLGVSVAILIFLGVTFTWAYMYAFFNHPELDIPPEVEFTMDRNTSTLIVRNISLNFDQYPNDLNWKDVEIYSGNATLPSGTIDIGDIITNCTGMVRLDLMPFNTILGIWDFT